MCDCVREATVKELIEGSHIDKDKKDLILSRMKEDDHYKQKRIESCENTIVEQRCLIESYRAVLKDMIYSNCMNFK